MSRYNKGMHKMTRIHKITMIRSSKNKKKDAENAQG